VTQLELLLRVAFAMAVVVAVMWVAARLLARRGRVLNLAGRPTEVEVLGRRGLSRNSSVAVVRTGGRTLIVGVTDTHVSLLAEADPSVFEVAEGESRMLDPGGPAPTLARTQILETLRERTVRR
jgi:flagellar biogenesis protein FliO